MRLTGGMQIIPICTTHGCFELNRATMQNGGSARVLLDVDPDHSSPSAAAGNEVGITSARQGAPQL
jgi:hypothetical protein